MEFLTNVTPASNVENSLDAMLSQNYNISNHAFDVKYYKHDCKTELIHSVYQQNNVISGIEANPVFIKLESSAIFNSSEFFYADLDGIYNGDESGGYVNICIRSDIFLTDEKIVSMNFLEKRVDIFVSLHSASFNFDIDAYRTGTSENENIDVDYSKYVEGYQCDPNNAGDANYEGTYAQGSILNICVRSKNPQVIDVETFLNILVEQDVDVNGKKFQYITDGAYHDGITHIDCETNSSPIKICVGELNLLGIFFEEGNPPNLKVSGDMTFTFLESGETHLLRGVDLQLKSPKHGRVVEFTTFDIEINLISSKTSFSTIMASKGAISMSLVAFSVMVGAILFILMLSQRVYTSGNAHDKEFHNLMS